MVCDKCEKKLEKLATPDTWKDGAKNGGKEGGRKVGQNMLLSSKAKVGFDPFGNKCKLCKQKVPKSDQYCQGCAYKKGLCKMCGVKVLDTKFYRQSNV
ncbi:hypothetical protein ABPG74_006433 [Tetrahymena malaccensis]